MGTSLLEGFEKDNDDNKIDLDNLCVLANDAGLTVVVVGGVMLMRVMAQKKRHPGILCCRQLANCAGGYRRSTCLCQTLRGIQ